MDSLTTLPLKPVWLDVLLAKQVMFTQPPPPQHLLLPTSNVQNCPLPPPLVQQIPSVAGRPQASDHGAMPWLWRPFWPFRAPAALDPKSSRRSGHAAVSPRRSFRYASPAPGSTATTAFWTLVIFRTWEKSSCRWICRWIWSRLYRLEFQKC